MTSHEFQLLEARVIASLDTVIAFVGAFVDDKHQAGNLKIALCQVKRTIETSLDAAYWQGIRDQQNEERQKKTKS